MKNIVRCKACGFLMEEGQYHECPACGVPEKMFEAYEDKVPEQRRKILKMHLHPVIVHAPQALGFLLLALGALHIFLTLVPLFGDFDQALLQPAILLMTIMLPITVLGAIFSGLLDGKVRYKKLNTILLKKKMLVGSLFLVFSAGMVVAVLQPGYAKELLTQGLYLLFNLGAFACSVILGLWGAALNAAEMPGPWPKKKTPAPVAKAE